MQYQLTVNISAEEQQLIKKYLEEFAGVDMIFNPVPNEETRKALYVLVMKALAQVRFGKLPS